jgi:dTDP-4-dehydrorhamnose 3,5-epimerase
LDDCGQHIGNRGKWAGKEGLMRIETLAIPDVKLVMPGIVRDHRGFFSETFNGEAFRRAVADVAFVQDNHSFSCAKGVVRGLHFQSLPHAQGKLVRVTRGSVFDVAVDVRRGSPTYGRHVSALLSAENWAQLWIPVGFAHGFCTLEADTEVLYKVTDYYAPACDRGLLFDDPDLGIEWPVSPAQAILSDKDRWHVRLRDLPAYFTYTRGRGD